MTAMLCLGSAMSASQANDFDVASNLIALERIPKMQAGQSKDVTALGVLCSATRSFMWTRRVTS